MALSSVTTDTMANYKVTSGTLSGGDDPFTFATNMRRFWISTPAAAVSMTLAAASASHSPYTFPVAQSVEMRLDGLASKVVTLKGTNTQIVTILEELLASI